MYMANRALAIWILSWLFALVILVLSSPRYYPGALSQSRSSANVGDREHKRVLLLTAHPDDECMFFAPTLLALSHARDLRDGGLDHVEGQTRDASPADVYVLCLSSGDADGLGETRKRELQGSLDFLGVKQGRRWVLDEPFHDNITVFWDAELIAKHVRSYVENYEINIILTFDDRGISSHPNHISLERGVRVLLANPPRKDLRAFSLKTVALFPKYTGAGAALFAKLEPTFCAYLPNSYFTRSFPVGSAWRFPGVLRILDCSKYDEVGRSKRAVLISGWTEYTTALSAMRQHQSQLVWFRWLYVTFSRYMWVNEWEEIIV